MKSLTEPGSDRRKDQRWPLFESIAETLEVITLRVLNCQTLSLSCLQDFLQLDMHLVNDLCKWLQ